MIYYIIYIYACNPSEQDAHRGSAIFVHIDLSAFRNDYRTTTTTTTVLHCTIHNIIPVNGRRCCFVIRVSFGP